jgi:FtsZ-interacting cell division protein ZipA
LSVAQLGRFRELLQAAATELGATVEFDDENAALSAAAELDAFCADHDVAIGLNVVPNETMGLLGTKLRALAESSGFVLAADGAFHLNDERGGALVALMSMDGVPFEAGSLKNLRSYGITLLLDVPRVGDGRQVFRRMTDLARHLATSLDGTVVDDKRTPLEQPSLDKITRQIESIQRALKGRGIIPGGPVALRLFQ